MKPITLFGEQQLQHATAVVAQRLWNRRSALPAATDAARRNTAQRQIPCLMHSVQRWSDSADERWDDSSNFIFRQNGSVGQDTTEMSLGQGF